MNFADMNFAQMFTQALIRPANITTLMDRFHMMLGPFRATWVMSQFSQLRNLDEKFAFIWNLPEAHQCLIPPKLRTSSVRKPEGEAERMKTEGNILYKQKKLKDALNCYSAAIMMASHPELSASTDSDSSHDEGVEHKKLNWNNSEKKYKTLACSYANRAAVLLEMKQYDKCLSDIELALECGYPELLRSKLLDRKERCLNAQKQCKKDENKSKRDLPVLSEPNKTIPALSSAVKLAYSKEKGRHVVAVKDIHPGDVIAVEESPFIFIRFDRFSICCAVCSRFCDTPLPCPSCWVGFCSDICRTIGLRDCHSKECRVFPALFDLELDLSTYTVMALKILFRTPFAELKEKLLVLQNEAKELSPEKRGFNSEGIYATDYRSVFHMSSSLPSRSEQHTYKMCLTAVVLTKLLCEVEGIAFNNPNLPQSDFRDIVTKGTVILHLLDNRPIQFGLVMEKAGDLGTGIFPSVALMNHSCSASAMYYNIGHMMIVRALRSVPAGKEVTVSYGPRFERHPKLVRKQLLGKLNISCSCEACVENWPLIEYYPDVVEFKCIKCSKTLRENKCTKCHIDYDKSDYEGEKKSMVEQWRMSFYRFRQAEEKFHATSAKIASRQSVTKDEFDAVCKFAMLLEKHIVFPSKIFFSVHSVMALYFLMH